MSADVSFFTKVAKATQAGLASCGLHLMTPVAFERGDRLNRLVFEI